MKAIKSITIFTFFTIAALFVVLGGFNSIYTDQTAFMENDFDIKFAKRIDEMNGEVTVGRLAASLRPWKDSVKKIDMNKVNAQASSLDVYVVGKEVKAQVAAVQDSFVPEPAVKDNLVLELTGGLYDKASINIGNNISGAAETVDGVIQNVKINLPGGEVFTIDTRERMVGNVFEFEDSQTRELRSGLFYKVKANTYMITITDDSKYAGLRLEFKAESKGEREENFGQAGYDQELAAIEKEEKENQAEQQKEESNESQFDSKDSYAQTEESNQNNSEVYEYQNEYNDEYDNENIDQEQFAKNSEDFYSPVENDYFKEDTMQLDLDTEQSYGHNFNQ